MISRSLCFILKKKQKNYGIGNSVFSYKDLLFQILFREVLIMVFEDHMLDTVFHKQPRRVGRYHFCPYIFTDRSQRISKIK